MSLIMIAAGAIIGLRVAFSMLLGGLLNYGYLAPMMYGKGIIREFGYRGIVAWSLWGGTALMLTSGLLAFAFQWRSHRPGLFRSDFNFHRSEGKNRDPQKDSLEKIEVPGTWFLFRHGPQAHSEWSRSRFSAFPSTGGWGWSPS